MEAFMQRLSALAACAMIATACGGDDSCVDGGTFPDGGGSPDGGPASTRRIFVTSGTWDGSLAFHGSGATGLQGADNLCNAAATGALLGGTWKAWLSDMNTDAIDRIADVGPWHLVGANEIVFNNKANLASTPIVAIDHDESGEYTFTDVWTGTSVGGRGGATCGSWTISSSDIDAIVGHSTYEDSFWTEYPNFSHDCSAPAGLYCIEQ